MSSRVFLYVCRNWCTAEVVVQNASLRLFRFYLCFKVRVPGLPTGSVTGWLCPSSTPFPGEDVQKCSTWGPLSHFQKWLWHLNPHNLDPKSRWLGFYITVVFVVLLLHFSAEDMKVMKIKVPHLTFQNLGKVCLWVTTRCKGEVFSA